MAYEEVFNVISGNSCYTHYIMTLFRIRALVFVCSILVLLPGTILACGMNIFSPLGSLLERKDTKVLLSFAEGRETLVFRLDFTGNADDFGAVIAVPSRPTIKVASDGLFPQLADLLAPPTTYKAPGGILDLGLGYGQATGLVAASTVRVVQSEKTVGDLKTSILTADSVSDLTGWLRDNDYAYTSDDEKNIDYYVRRGGHYFIALKIDADKFDSGTVNTPLKPVAVTFASSAPIMPMRLVAKHDGAPGATESFTLFTLSDAITNVPGSVVEGARQLTWDDVLNTAPSLIAYDAVGQWLVRQKVTYDPARIEEDLVLERAEPSYRVSGYAINIADAPVRSGIVPSKAAAINVPLSVDAAKSGLPTLLIARAVASGAVAAILIIIVLMMRIVRARRVAADDAPQPPSNLLRIGGVAFLTLFFAAIAYVMVAAAIAGMDWLNRAAATFVIVLYAAIPASFSYMKLRAQAIKERAEAAVMTADSAKPARTSRIIRLALLTTWLGMTALLTLAVWLSEISGGEFINYSRSGLLEIIRYSSQKELFSAALVILFPVLCIILSIKRARARWFAIAIVVFVMIYYAITRLGVHLAFLPYIF